MALIAQATASAHIVTLLPMVGGDWLLPDEDGFDLEDSEQARVATVSNLTRMAREDLPTPF